MSLWRAWSSILNWDKGGRRHVLIDCDIASTHSMSTVMFITDEVLGRSLWKKRQEEEEEAGSEGVGSG